MVRPARTRLWPLIAVTIRVASLGVATVGLLKTLCGSWTSVVLLRRRLLSIMSLLFAASDCGALEDVVKLSPELKSELWCLASLGPVVAVDLRAEPADFLSATDASTWGGAGVRTGVPRSVTLELCRHSLFKGTWTHLLMPGHAWLREHDLLNVGEELPGDEAFEPNLLASFLATRLQYSEAWRKGFRGPEHINCKEVRAYLREEFLIARRNGAIRLVTGLDSQVSLGLLSEGPLCFRIAELPPGDFARALPRLWRVPSLPLLLERVQPETRGRAPPTACGSLPGWWRDLCSGNTGPFDDWLVRVGASRPGFSFDHIGGSTPPAGLPTRRRRTLLRSLLTKLVHLWRRPLPGLRLRAARRRKLLASPSGSTAGKGKRRTLGPRRSRPLRRIRRCWPCSSQPGRSLGALVRHRKRARARPSRCRGPCEDRGDA